MKKTFKIGEQCIGGIIEVEIVKSRQRPTFISVRFLDWDSKKVVCFENFTLSDTRQCEMYLCDNSTSYYADKVMSWIKPNIQTELKEMGLRY